MSIKLIPTHSDKRHEVTVLCTAVFQHTHRYVGQQCREGEPYTKSHVVAKSDSLADHETIALYILSERIVPSWN